MMTQERGVAIREDKAVAIYELETRFALAVRQRELLDTYIAERLHPGRHFYKVGESKPSLTKEGAELICLPHALKPHYEWVSGPEYPPQDNTPYQITMKCILEANGVFGGEGIGSASSYITKKDGTWKARQNDPGLCHNATTKMACKSCYIAATLNATAASEFFTQDLEDDHTGEFTKPQPTDGHWCSAHGAAFFKRGNMRRYAHPIGDTGGWCNEAKAETPKPAPAKKAEKVVEVEYEEEPPLQEEEVAEPAQPKAKPAQPSTMSGEKFATYAKAMGCGTYDQRCKALGVKDMAKWSEPLEIALDRMLQLSHQKGELKSYKDWRDLPV